MGFLDSLRKLFGGGAARPESNLIEVRVRCKRCGEILTAHVNRNNDLTMSDGGGYYIHKTLVGSGSAGTRCFQRVEVDLEFDSNRQLTERRIQGGDFVDETTEEKTGS